MAIYSCNLASVGRTTHAAGTAGANLRYIAREGAEPIVEAHVIPSDPTQARAWMDRAEAADRANARVADKIRVAIPRELSRDERLQLVRDFVRGITQDRVPWMFAIHQEGHDAGNPHAHVVVRDRDIETGKRVLRLSDSARDREAAGLEPKAVEFIRIEWERHANAALERAGHDERIDRRTLQVQGIEREPTIHLGPCGHHVDQYVQRPTSKKRKNALGREIDYEAIDQGRTRKERHAEIVDLNLERDARSPHAETRLWAKFEREQRKLDFKLEAGLAEQARKATQERRALKATFRAQLKAVRQQRAAAYQQGIREQRDAAAPQIATLRQRQAQEREAIKRRHDHPLWRLVRIADITGGTRRRQEAARIAQIAAHRRERGALAAGTRRAWLGLKDSTRNRFAPEESLVLTQRAVALAALREMHRRTEAMADAKRQLREAAREQARVQTAKALELTKRQQRAPQPDRKAVGASLQAKHDAAREGFERVQKTRKTDADRRRAEIMRRLQIDRKGRGPSRER